MDWQWPSATPCQTVMNNPTILSMGRISWPSVYERMYHPEEGPSKEPDSSSCYSCSRSRSSGIEVHIFPKIWAPPHTCTPQHGDMKQLPHRGATVQNVLALRTWSPESLHPCSGIWSCITEKWDADVSIPTLNIPETPFWELDAWRWLHYYQPADTFLVPFSSPTVPQNN